MSGLDGLRVLALESRRAAELAKLISTYGGTPVVAPAMREVPLESNTEALAFAEALLAGQFDMVILLTGVGTRAVLSVAETKFSRDAFVAALQRVKVVPRGPKPIAVLRELGVTPRLRLPSPTPGVSFSKLSTRLQIPHRNFACAARAWRSRNMAFRIPD